jgi:site-specific recombinase XerD
MLGLSGNAFSSQFTVSIFLGQDQGEDYRPGKNEAVWLADDGKPLTHHGVSMLFKRLKKRTGIDDKRVSAHNCRRYMATTEMANGRSPFDVQRQMRHKTLKMTNHYASLSIRQLRKSHENTRLGRKEKMNKTGRMALVIGRNRASQI